MDDQDQNQQKKMKSIGTILSIYCYVVGGAFIFLAKPYKLLSVACMAGCALCLVIYMKFPGYFTIIEAKKDAEKKGRKPRTIIGIPYATVLYALVFRSMKDFSFNSWTGLVIGTALLTVVISVILGKMAKEHREWKENCALIVILILFMSSGVVGQLNYLLDFGDGRIYYTEVVDRHISSGKSTSYYCTVLLEDGEEFDIQVDREMYQQIGVGSWVKITTYEGGLGMEYVAITG